MEYRADLQTRNSKLQELNIILERLEQHILNPDAERYIRQSTVERSKVGFNVEHARNLLLRLGQDRRNAQSLSRTPPDDPELRKQRMSLKKLEDRLFEIDQRREEVDTGSHEDDMSGDSDTEELLRRYAPAVNDTNNGINVQAEDSLASDMHKKTTLAAASTLESTLRARRSGQSRTSNATHTGSATGRAGAQSGSQSKAAGTSPFQPSATTSARSDSETLLSHHSGEQEDLSGALLNLAAALKQSTISFSNSLAASNPLVDQTAASLDKSSGGMEAAQKRMGMLRRMTEGKGKLGRIILYLWVAGLWVVLILIMFVMPKLRF